MFLTGLRMEKTRGMVSIIKILSSVRKDCRIISKSSESTRGAYIVAKAEKKALLLGPLVLEGSG